MQVHKVSTLKNCRYLKSSLNWKWKIRSIFSDSIFLFFIPKLFSRNFFHSFVAVSLECRFYFKSCNLEFLYETKPTLHSFSWWTRLCGIWLQMRHYCVYDWSFNLFITWNSCLDTQIESFLNCFKCILWFDFNVYLN